MPFKTSVDPKTGKPKTYAITGSGRVWLEDGKLIKPGTMLPHDVKRAADQIKAGAMKPFSKRKP